MTARTFRDEVLPVIVAAAGAVPIQWTDVASDPLTADQWLRVTIQHTDGGQTTLRGDTGQRKFRSEGVITVQVFTRQGTGLSNAYDLATTVKHALEDLHGSTRLQRVRLQEAVPRNGFSQINVLSDFEYDDVR
jgi:hypothetical protein